MSANLTSLHVFRNYLRYLEDGTVDASQIHSPACYSAWLKARGSEHCVLLAKRFQRSLTNHLAGVDGRCPFTLAEEAAILKVLRRKFPWPCFPPPLTIGSTGYRSKGFHEKRRESGKQTTTTTTPPAKTTTLDSVVLDIQKKRMRVSEALHPTYLAQYTALAASLVNFHDAFAAFEIDVWPSILAQMRFVIFPSAAFPSNNNNRTEAYANDLCEWHSTRKRHDDSIMVFVFDFEQQQVMAQNERCRTQFGPLQGKFCGEILRHMDLAKLTLAMAGAFLDPQNELDTLMDVVCGRLRIAKQFNVNINVDPQSSLVVVLMGK